MIDVSFRLKGRCLAISYHYPLAEEISQTFALVLSRAARRYSPDSSGARRPRVVAADGGKR